MEQAHNNEVGHLKKTFEDLSVNVGAKYVAELFRK
jgi:hypothetical protein